MARIRSLEGEAQVTGGKSDGRMRSSAVYVAGAIIGFTMAMAVLFLRYHVPFFRNGGLAGGAAFIATACLVGLLYRMIFKSLRPLEKRFITKSRQPQRSDLPRGRPGS